MNEAKGGCVDRERLPELERGFDPATDQRIVCGRFTERQQTKRDLRAIAEEGVTERAAARISDHDAIAGLRAHVGHVGAVNPQVAALEPLLASRGNGDAGGSGSGVQGSRFIVQSSLVRIAIGADHAGFLLKEYLKQTLQRLGHAIDDYGT